MIEQELLKSLQYARLAVDLASEKLANDIVLLDVNNVSGFADYFVIMTADSSRQMDTLSEDMKTTIEGAGLKLHHREGSAESGWILLDFGDVIIDLFGQDVREFYGLENVWSHAVEVLRIQ